ncbi:IclR family transcriptional regulator C-terminal domain-containing protein [Actinoplanes sp. NBRC 103695]|uniref:IclR family transcriptional regulator n=1 Tax=Actinoplanes sp. NBRC 103695 TaxID=3032202 RepID=UPI0024A2F7A2|nr:IclR family transcriptional regulator C-terminal domain-containing protein [Actinoplanes sp. NBRC 103695]GLY99938.1 IclR family transcriptional regulator [Actinoplanes sp. NBRC 103695]
MERAAQRNIPDVAVARIAAVLTCFDDVHRSLRVSEVSRRSGLPMSTTSRLVAELVRYGFLWRAGAGLRLGELVAATGRLAATDGDLRTLAEPHLTDLTAATGLTAHLTVLDGPYAIRLASADPGDACMCSEQSERERHASRDAHMCSEQRAVAAHACAAGKALLAAASPEVVDGICAASLAATGPRTITDPRRLRRELDRIRSGGVAYDCEESGRGLGGLAEVIPGRDVAVEVAGRVNALDPRAVAPALRLVTRALGRILN